MHGTIFPRVCRKSRIAHNFTAQSMTIQKNLALKLSKEKSAPVYIFDETNFFDDAVIKTCENIRYYEKSDKYAVLSMTAQKVMQNKNDYLHFHDNGYGVVRDELGICVDFRCLPDEAK